MIDIDMLIADRATRGEFTIEERLAESSGSSFYVVTSTTRPSLRLFARERSDSEYAAALMNVAASQLVDQAPAVAAPTAIQRAAEIG